VQKFSRSCQILQGSRLVIRLNFAGLWCPEPSGTVTVSLAGAPRPKVVSSSGLILQVRRAQEPVCTIESSRRCQVQHRYCRQQGSGATTVHQRVQQEFRGPA
jgi:hypothetical protein